MNRTDFQFFFPFRIRYAETDAQGIVFYGNYLIYFDTAIYEYFRAISSEFENHVEKTGADFHIVHTSVDYFAPVRFDDQIEVGVRTLKIGNTSLTFEVGVFLVGNNEPLVKGRLVWVNTDQTTLRAVPLPADLGRRLHEFEKLIT